MTDTGHISLFRRDPEAFRELYFAVIQFLLERYGMVRAWECRRLLMCLDAGLYFLERTPAGVICTYVGWWLVPAAEVPRLAEQSLTVAETLNMDITAGTTIWVMDGASTTPEGIRHARRHLRARYPVTSGIQGIAWLRHKTRRAIVSPRQKGV